MELEFKMEIRDTGVHDILEPEIKESYVFQEFQLDVGTGAAAELTVVAPVPRQRPLEEQYRAIWLHFERKAVQNSDANDVYL